jgi:hypothetical protein
VLAAYMPETRGRSLEDIQNAFHHQGPQLQSIARRISRWISSAGSVHSSEGSHSDGSMLELNTIFTEGPSGSSSVETPMASGALRDDAAS